MIPTIFQWYYCKCKCSKMSLKVALKERANHDNNPAVPNISQYQGILKTWGHKCRRSHPNRGLRRESAVFRCQVRHTSSRPRTQKALKSGAMAATKWPEDARRIWKHMKTWDGGVTLSQDCHKDRSSKKGNQIALWIDHALWCSTMLLSCYMFPIISLCLAVTNWAVDSCRCLDFKRSISLACYTAPPIPKRGWLAQEEFIEMRHTEAQKRHEIYEMEGKWSLAA